MASFLTPVWSVYIQLPTGEIGFKNTYFSLSAAKINAILMYHRIHVPFALDYTMYIAEEAVDSKGTRMRRDGTEIIPDQPSPRILAYEELNSWTAVS